MKNYPRIYSLSTLGLIHHYENDYLSTIADGFRR